MRIRGLEIRKIIREELKRTLLKEASEYSDGAGYKFKITKDDNGDPLLVVISGPKGPYNPPVPVDFEERALTIFDKLQPQDQALKDAKEYYEFVALGDDGGHGDLNTVWKYYFYQLTQSLPDFIRPPGPGRFPNSAGGKE